MEHTLAVANDNDFVPGIAGPNLYFVFGFTAADLNGSLFDPQQIPEPASAGLLAVGLLGLLVAFGGERLRTHERTLSTEAHKTFW